MTSDSSTLSGSRFSETSTGLRLQDRHQVANSHEIVELVGFLRRQFAVLILRRQLVHPSLVIRRKTQLQNMTGQCGRQCLPFVCPDTRKDGGFTYLGTRNYGCGRQVRILESLKPWPPPLWDVIAANLHRSLCGPQRPGRFAELKRASFGLEVPAPFVDFVFRIRQRQRAGYLAEERSSRQCWIALASRRESRSYCWSMIFCLSGGAISKKRRRVRGGSVRSNRPSTTATR